MEKQEQAEIIGLTYESYGGSSGISGDVEITTLSAVKNSYPLGNFVCPSTEAECPQHSLVLLQITHNNMFTKVVPIDRNVSALSFLEAMFDWNIPVPLASKV